MSNSLRKNSNFSTKREGHEFIGCGNSGFDFALKGRGFSRAVSLAKSMAALQIAEKLKLRIRASLQRCRKFFELRRPFRGCAPKTGFFSNLFSRRRATELSR
jgi:hypothetical protein